jgi:hypothetical protein
MKTGKIHAAKVKTSKRLQRFLSVLQSAKVPLSTRTLQISANVVNPNSCAAELREQGFLINVEQKGKHFFYSLIGEQLQEN